MPSIVETRTIINYLHGINIDNNLDFIRANYGNPSFIRFINALLCNKNAYLLHIFVKNINYAIKISTSII